jgi:hypothetical protein
MNRHEEAAYLRDLARKQREYVNSAVNIERRESWLAAHGLRARRPLVLTEVWGIRDPHPPYAFEPKCASAAGRHIESQLRGDLWHFEQLRDDYVLEPRVTCPWQVTFSDYGVTAEVHRSDDAGIMGSCSWTPPITFDDFEAGYAKLHPRACSVDREGSLRFRDEVQDLLGDTLPAELRGSFFWTQGMTIVLIHLIGLEPLMLAMYDAPALLHRMMRFLCDDHKAVNRWLEREGLLTLNNGNDYIGSGSRGHVPDLPQPDWKPGMPARLKDLWCLSESQETVGVGPDLFAEFIYPYQKELADTFGLTYYGCCEPVHSRWHVLKRLENLRAVSISPWCDEAFMADALGSRYVYSRKPNPTLISTERFDEVAIRADIRKTLDVTLPRQCNVEIVMKDVHTLHDEPHRAARWVQLARQEIARAGFPNA